LCPSSQKIHNSLRFLVRAVGSDKRSPRLDAPITFSRPPAWRLAMTRRNPFFFPPFLYDPPPFFPPQSNALPKSPFAKVSHPRAQKSPATQRARRDPLPFLQSRKITKAFSPHARDSYARTIVFHGSCVCTSPLPSTSPPVSTRSTHSVRARCWSRQTDLISALLPITNSPWTLSLTISQRLLCVTTQWPGTARPVPQQLFPSVRVSLPMVNASRRPP